MSKGFSAAAAVLATLLSAGAFLSCSNASGMTGLDAFVIYNGNGTPVSYEKMMQDISRSDVILFGEMHNDPISHWMELNIAKDLYESKGDGLVIGAEMWESDNQLTLDEFVLDSLMDMDTYVANSRLWPNFDTDYKPVLEFAAGNRIPFVATNVPRKYANMVSKMGLGVLDSLDTAAYSYMAPLPIEVDYEDRLYEYVADFFKNMGGMPAKKSDVRNLVDAQALKDATMAYFITENREDDQTFFHFQGELHSAYHSAIAYYIRKYAPGTKISTVSVEEAEDPAKAKIEKGRADYVVVVPLSMTRTYAD